MPAIEVGRVCVKITGREAGKKCVIVDLIDKNFALVSGPKEITGVKRRRTNLDHLEATEEKIEIEKGVGDEELVKVLKKTGKAESMKVAVKPAIA